MRNYLDESEEVEDPSQDQSVSVRDYLAQRLAQKDQELASAQDQAARGKGIAGIASGMGQIVAGLSRSDKGFDGDAFKSLDAQAEQPVQDFLQRQKAKSTGLQDAAAEQKFNMSAEELDPNSVRSQMVQKIFQKYNPNLAGVPFAAKDAGTIERLEAVNEQAKTRREIAKGNAGNKALLDQQKADAELGKARAGLGSRGGNAKYVDALRRADNISKLLDQYPDLDKMPKEQVNLLYSEIDSLVNGGAPTIAGTHGITPSSWLADLNSVVSKAGSKPIGAQLGKFIEQIDPYLEDVSGNARKHLIQENNSLTDAYRGRLAPDAYQRHKAEIEQSFAPPVRRRKQVSPTAPSQPMIGPFADPAKEKKYQEWKRQQGAQ